MKKVLNGLQVIGQLIGNLTGNADTATKLKTARAINGVLFDGSADINIPTGSAPIGQIAIYPMQTLPSGWIECDGRAISRTTYAALFAVIGTSYGSGDGSTTFNLPDTRGEFIRGWDHGRGVDSGRGFGSTQTDAFKSHAHGLPMQIASQGQQNTYTGFMQNNTWGNGVQQSAQSTLSTGSTETRPRNVAWIYAIYAGA